MGIELPTDVQQILDSSDPRFAGAQNGPVIPGTQMPVPPAQQQLAPAAPDIAPSNNPGTLADKISKAFLEHLAANQPQPVRPQQPQQPSTAQRIAGAANGVMTALGDASHANDVKGGGWLTGVTSTLAARNQRIAGSRTAHSNKTKSARKLRP